VVVQRCSQRLAIEAETASDPDEHLQVGDILALTVESVEHSGVKLVALPLRARPVGGFMGEARTRLHRRENHFDAQEFGKREDGLVPGPLNVLTVRVERRDGFGTQLERAPDDLDVRVGLR